MFIVLRKCIVKVQVLVNGETLNIEMPFFTKLNVNYLNQGFFNEDDETKDKLEKMLKEILWHHSYTSKNRFYEEIVFWQVIDVSAEDDVIGIDL